MINGITHENLGKNISLYEEKDLQRIKELYICFDFRCNLNCPHCTLKSIPQHYEFDKIFQTLQYIHNINKDFTINLFGGEPMLLKDENLKLFEPILLKHPLIISTNLLQLTPYKLELMKYAEDINTSWNPQRFTDEQYIKWLNNIDELNKNNISYSVMVTLTQDLINMQPKDFYNKILSWNNCRNIDLKQMIGDLNIDFKKVDKWLCELYNVWKDKPKNLLFNEIQQIIDGKRIWKNYCKTYFTLMPNGQLKDGCPYYEYEPKKDFCLICEYYPICQGGCNIQDKCTFPKQLYERMKNENFICHTKF